ncbi:MAG TPA: hypothetical protein DCZ03_11195 [Gammaproteobacteria bacterium]|nr:hypothetical protein [Gammaproteobacteria bacterium]
MWQKLATIDRSVYLYWFGFACLALAVTQHWYTIPDALMSYAGEHPSRQFVAHIPLVVSLYKFATILFCTLVIFVWMKRCWTERWMRAALWTFLLLLLGFSYFVNQWSPQTLVDSSILHYEMTRVITDMEENITHQQRDWRVNQIISGEWDNPAFFFMQFPGEDRWEWALLLPGRQLHVLVNIFGLSNAFQTFAARGWFLTIVGVLILLFAQYLQMANGAQALRRDLGQALVIGLSLLLVSLSPRFIAGYYQESADLAQAQGDYAKAIAHWQRAVIWRPDLDYSLMHHRRIGEAQLQMRCFDCFDAHLAYAFDAIYAQDYPEVFRRFELAQAQRPDFKPLIYWWAAARSEHAVNLFDLGYVSQANDEWNLALRQVPTMPMAWYGSMLANIRMKQFDAAARAAENLWWLHGYFGFKHLTLRSQAWVTQSWQAFHAGDYAAAHHHYTTALTPDNW